MRHMIPEVIRMYGVIPESDNLDGLFVNSILLMGTGYGEIQGPNVILDVMDELG